MGPGQPFTCVDLGIKPLPLILHYTSAISCFILEESNPPNDSRNQSCPNRDSAKSTNTNGIVISVSKRAPTRADEIRTHSVACWVYSDLVGTDNKHLPSFTLYGAELINKH